MVDNDIIRCCIWLDSSINLFHKDVDSVTLGTIVLEEEEDGSNDDDDGVIKTESNKDGPNKLL